MGAVALMVEPEDLYRWTADQFMALINAGMIEEPRRLEPLDGIVERTMPPGELHRFIFKALNRVFSAIDAYERGMESIPPVIFGSTLETAMIFPAQSPETRSV